MTVQQAQAKQLKQTSMNIQIIRHFKQTKPLLFLFILNISDTRSTTTCICYAQSSDRDNPRIVLRKPWIWALCRQSEDWPYTRPRTISCAWHVYANWITAHCCYQATDENPFPSDEEGQKQIFNMRVGLHQIYVRKHTIYWSCSVT